MTDLRLTLSPESPEDAEAVEKLNERAFGPGRFARSAIAKAVVIGLVPDQQHQFVSLRFGGIQ